MRFNLFTACHTSLYYIYSSNFATVIICIKYFYLDSIFSTAHTYFELNYEYLNSYFIGVPQTDKWVLSGLLILIRHGDRGPLQHVKKISSINCGTENSELLTSYKVYFCFVCLFIREPDKQVLIFYSRFL